jgi:hypothetical protein
LSPVPKPETLAVWRTSEHDDQPHNDQSHDGDELDGGKPELGLPKDLNGDDVESQYDNQNDGDPHPGWDR